ncbi:PREDICTED: protein LURP-one-related 14 [Nelumbo nucifera]|uniref:Protein LURP-one-related 14-like n=2 Tax=Nelumbo nucifera TaxID=4432 RepID=A0A822Y331_NELNU|nr:PREDICTED: protein LURP-one-related 14 [Nelumbo nucifera]DAD26393.1 TPA_asm: hypothetical protein HUJ06_027861 [Nelumbo nucifera]
MATHHQWAYGIPAPPPLSVVGEGFCVPYPVDLIVKKKIVGLSDARFEVMDANGNLLLQVDGSLWSLQKKRVMRDSAGFPILTMREKVLTARHRWTVHRGDSSDGSNLLFSVQRSHPLQIKTQLDVFLANNFHEDICNFNVTGSYSDQSCRVYKGDTLIAEANHKFTWGRFCKGKDNFTVKVNPGVDYAFIVTLIVILNENDIV